MTRSRGWCSVGEASLSTSLMEGDDDLCWEERGTEKEEERQGGGGGVEEEARERAWEAFSSGFREVQGVLEENRLLISQVNDNHSSRLPENLTKNVALIRQINANISKYPMMGIALHPFLDR
ncbi:hypothetical protein AMTRI_Chr08g159420 [Amborella trichopoda]